MHPHAALITRFYEAFQRRDSTGMAACYHPDVAFSDPAFGELKGNDARAMWAMLCERATDLSIEYSGVAADDMTGRAHWEARYTFTKTGRKVHNIIDATFAFKDGLIIRHDDRFNFWRWSRQALGPSGLFLGWTPSVQAKVRETALAGLQVWTRAQARRRS
jgi:ketosteroid isomerase-like protein